jgi:hypothetical protein
MGALIKLSEIDEQFFIENYPKYGPKFCADALNMSKSTLMKKSYKLGLIYRVNQEYLQYFFPVTEQSAYMFGFFTGDGYVISQDGNLNGINIEINADDGLDIENTLSFAPWRKYYRQRNNWKPNITFNISSRPLAKKFEELGFREKHLRFPDVTNLIPKKYLHIYLQGFLDADGSIMKRSNNNRSGAAYFCGSYNYDWSNFTKLIGSIVGASDFHIYNRKSKTGNSSTYKCQSFDSIISFLDYIYQDGNKYGLSRKYNKYLSLKKLE